MSRAQRPRGARAVEQLLSVVVSTYEWPSALSATLRALADQSDQRFDVVVTDDGSGPDTAVIVALWREVFGARLQHVWQPDEGFRLALARNRGAAAAGTDFVVFLDGDCVPRRHFVRALNASIRPGWFVAGRRVELTCGLTERVLATAAPLHRWSLARWVALRRHAAGLSALTARDRRRVGSLRVPEFEPHRRTYGFLLGVHRRDFELANGFDTRYVGWGEEDVDLATRLRRLGLRCGHAGAAATVLHLWHPPRGRPDRTNERLFVQVQHGAGIRAAAGLREVTRAETLGLGPYQTATIDP